VLEQLAQMLGVGAIGLRPALGAAQQLGLRRLGQVHLGADGAQLLDGEPPAGRRLERGLNPLALERRRKWRKLSRSAGRIRPRRSSPVDASSASQVICSRCWSNPITIVTRDLLRLRRSHDNSAHRRA
jgi:hypothetical protein